MWKYKIAALMHDPPYKPYFVTGMCKVPEKLKKEVTGEKAHERLAKMLQNSILGNNSEGAEDIEGLLRDADHYASGADRQIRFEQETNEFCFRHHVSGEVIPEGFTVSKDEEICEGIRSSLGYLEATLKKILEIIRKNDSGGYKEAFIFLWRYLPELTAVIGKDPLSARIHTEHVLELSFLLPADTRIPDHSLWDHLELTSAFFTALYHSNDFAVVALKIPGPQRLISASRKYRDLWGSSYLVSLAMTFILKNIAEEFGPDVVIIPSLRGNPLFDYYFIFNNDKRSKIYEEISKELEKVASLIENSKETSREFSVYSLIPNRSILILPSKYSEKDIGDYVEEICNKSIGELTKILIDGLRKLMTKLKNCGYIDVELQEGYDKAVEKQIRDRLMPKISVVRASDVSNLSKLRKILEGTSLEEDLNAVLETLNKLSKEKITGTKAAAYIFHIIESIARFKLENEVQEYRAVHLSRELCDVCGERESIFELKYKTLQKERTIKLCGVCFIKRYLDKILKETKLGELMEFRFLSHVDLSLMKSIKNLKYIVEYIFSEDILSGPKDLPYSVGIMRDNIGIVKKYIRREDLKGLLKDLREDIKRIIGDPKKFFDDFESSLREVAKNSYEFNTEEIVDYLTAQKEDVFQSLEEHLRDPNLKTLIATLKSHVMKLRKLLKVLNSSKYKSLIREVFGTTVDDILEGMKFYAVIKGDGDSIGSLLSRKILIEENNKSSYAPMKIYMHEGLYSEFKNDIKRISTPSYVKTVSSSLTNYVVWLLNRLKELNEKYSNSIFYSIIYLGGDDIFIISDPSSALEISSLIVEGFSKTHDKMPIYKEEKEDQRQNSVTKVLPGWSMSISLVWAHYKYPLRDVIRASSYNLERAKNAQWSTPLEKFKAVGSYKLLPSKSKSATCLSMVLSTGISEGLILRNFSHDYCGGYYYVPLRALYLLKFMNLLPKTSVSRLIHSLLEITANIKGKAAIELFTSHPNDNFFRLLIKKEIRDHVLSVKPERREDLELAFLRGLENRNSIAIPVSNFGEYITSREERRSIDDYIAESFKEIKNNMHFERKNNIIGEYHDFFLLLKLLHRISRYYVIWRCL